LSELGGNCDIFGVFDNIEKLENGWLTDDIAIHVRLTSKAIQWISEETAKRKVRGYDKPSKMSKEFIIWKFKPAFRPSLS